MQSEIEIRVRKFIEFKKPAPEGVSIMLHYKLWPSDVGKETHVLNELARRALKKKVKSQIV